VGIKGGRMERLHGVQIKPVIGFVCGNGEVKKVLGHSGYVIIYEATDGMLFESPQKAVKHQIKINKNIDNTAA